MAIDCLMCLQPHDLVYSLMYNFVSMMSTVLWIRWVWVAVSPHTGEFWSVWLTLFILRCIILSVWCLLFYGLDEYWVAVSPHTGEFWSVWLSCSYLWFLFSFPCFFSHFVLNDYATKFWSTHLVYSCWASITCWTFKKCLL